MPQETNLNRTPYFDDFDPDKDFHKVLFKPGYSIQARELTTLQSILQNQIEKFGTHFFKEGSRVIPGAVTYSLDYRSVQIEPQFLGLPVSLYQEELIGKQIRGSESGVIATIKNAEINLDTDNIILYIDYENSGNNFTDNLFIDGENLITSTDITFGLSNIISSGEEFAKVISSNSTNIGSAVFISEGVYFIRGYFVRVAPQTLVLDSFSNTPTYRVGLFINEEIVTADQDESLYDNSRGFSNYAAPGADRFKISTTLSKKSVDDFEDENFIELLRLNDGILEKIVDKTQYNIIAEELARRTYDESGDYYVSPFTIIPRNTLNNRINNNGLYFENQLTTNGRVPSDDLMTYKISPGKAYIRGFEVAKDSQTYIDIEKPRTTGSVNSEGIGFNGGTTLFVNNVLGQPSVGIATTAILSLRSHRRGIGIGASGSEIGVARAYDFSLASSSGIVTNYQLKMFDIQTFTSLGLSTFITLPQSSLVEGKSSGARGYLRSSVSSASSITLYDVSGRFAKDEALLISGIGTYGHIVKSIKDYRLSDVNSIFSYRDTATSTVGFNADVVLDVEIQPTINIINPTAKVTTPSFTISARDPDTGICTVTSTSSNFIGIASVGNIVSYSKPGFSTVTYNQIVSVSESGRVLGIITVTSVPGVCDGIPTPSEIVTSDFAIRAPKILTPADPSFTTKLSKTDVSTIDTENTDVIVKRQYNINSFSSNVITAPSLDTDFTYQPYFNERYSLTYSDGRVENLSSDKFFFTNGFRNLEIKNLSVASGTNATLIVSLKKNKVKEKIKKLNKANTLVIDRSTSFASGTGDTTLNDGLTYSSVYGTRVQDKEISLNIPDVNKLFGVFESSDTSEPDLPSMTFVASSLTGPNRVATDLIVGDTITGSRSNALGLVVSKSTSSIEFVYLNSSSFISGETVSFKNSNITGICNVILSGDKNITSNYRLDIGQRPYFYDFSRIVKINSSYNPTRKIKIVFESYNLDSSDSGDIYTVDSYPTEEYASIGIFGNSRLSDLIDMRPRVKSYSTSSSLSPFEFGSRSFDGPGQSSSYYLAPNETFITSFSYYLPRIDKLFLTKEGSFQLQKGVPSDSPTPPSNVDGALEISSIFLPPYVYNISDVKISYAQHKRYRMTDISRLESRIANLEYYTQLSLLEVATDSLSIKTNGVDRFKCGFFVDNFKSHSAHEVTNPLFRTSIDIGKGYLRPLHYTTAIDLIMQVTATGVEYTDDSTADYRYEEVAENENIKKNKKIVTLAYTDVEFTKNSFATRIENVTPFLVTSYTGTIELNPSSDTWVNTNKIDPNKVTIEGTYKSTVAQLDVDVTTGFSPIDWGSWQTDWIGVDVSTDVSLDAERNVIIDKKNKGDVKNRTIRFDAPTPAGRSERGWWEREETYQDVEVTTGDKLTAAVQTGVRLNTQQSREGIRWNVTEQVDKQMLGPRIVNNQYIRYMRARNIEFVARGLKPTTQVYTFFDQVDVNSYCFPKLLEITMSDKTFSIGEKVTVYDPTNTSLVTGYFRVAQPDHKYGPYNAATVKYAVNPYDPTNKLPTAYTSSSSILNVDTSSLEEAAIGKFYGVIKEGATLIGSTSGAKAKVSKVRIVTDDIGTVIGSFFVPESDTLSFETGIKSFKVTNTKDNNPIPGSINSSAEEEFYSQGLLQTSQDTELGIRNAKIDKEIKKEKRMLSSGDTSSDTSSALVNLNNRIEEVVVNQGTGVYKDPLAQSFIIDQPNGVYVTKLDLFFYSKTSTKIPVTVQLRPIVSGVPSTLVLPFSEIELLPENINTSTDGTVATTVTFNAPVFMESGKEYAIVLLSDSTDYQVWISRMGEEDVTTRNNPESAKKIVSQQPTLGSLFKSQNGSTWEPSGYEDLKFTLYKAEFTTNPGTVTFYNPVEGGDYNTLSKVVPNNIISTSNKVKIGLSTSIDKYAGIVPGVSIGITDKSISGKLVGLAGSVSTINVSGFGLSSYTVGSGYTSAAYIGLSLDTITGEGSGLTVDVTFANGKLDLSSSGIVTVRTGGYGYRIGDIVGIPTSVSFGSGAKLTVQQLGSFNTLLLDNVQGNYSGVIGSRVTYQSATGITSYVGLATVAYIEQNTSYDGLHLRVNNYNHGMYSTNNIVRVNGVKSDLKPAKLSTNYTSSETSNIQLDSVSIFTSFENVGVSTTNPGYVRIGNELISYTGTDVPSNSLTGITRGVDANVLGTDIIGASIHNIGDSVMKYEFNGVSLRRINRIHNMSSPLATVPNSIDIDNYYLKIDMSDTTYGISRSNNPNGIPDLFFNETKNNSNFNYSKDDYVTSSKNIVFSTITPNVNVFTPKGTGVSSRIRTISATSVDGTEVSFEDLGFENIQLGNANTLSSLRMIASKDNETSKLNDLPGNKSFAFALDLFTADKNVSPVVDLERVNMILTANRLNKPISTWPGNDALSLTVRSGFEDPHSSVYISNRVNLANPATSLKVLFAAVRPNTSDIRVMYRLYREDSNNVSRVYEFFPGYENLNENGEIIDPTQNNGNPDQRIEASSTANDFKDYEYSIDNLPQFNSFSVKIIMTGTDQSKVPLLKDLRAIALA